MVDQPAVNPRWWLPEFLQRVEEVSASPGFGTVSVEVIEGQVKYLSGTWRKQRPQKALDTSLL